MATKILFIVVHCSATREDVPFTAEQVEESHRTRGFRSAGYNYYIRRDGNVCCMRPEGEELAHARGYNRNSVAVCYEGGLDATGQPADTRTEEQKGVMRLLIAQLLRRYPKACICGHRDLSPDLDGDGRIEPEEWIKQCPCFDAGCEYRDLYYV